MDFSSSFGRRYVGHRQPTNGKERGPTAVTMLSLREIFAMRDFFRQKEDVVVLVVDVVDGAGVVVVVDVEVVVVVGGS